MVTHACLPRCAPQDEPINQCCHRRQLHSSSSADDTIKCCTHYSLRHPCIVPAHLLTSASQNGCVTGHRLVLTERIRDPTLVMMTFSATSATMMFKSEGVMHTLVSAAQKHAFLPAWIAHRRLRQQQVVELATTSDCCNNKDGAV